MKKGGGDEAPGILHNIQSCNHRKGFMESDNLVREAQKAAFGKADDDDVVVKTKFVGGIAQVCD